MGSILIMEDEEMTRRELRRYLEQNGYTVWAPEKVPETEAVLEQEVDLVLMDIDLGRQDGISLCRQIRKKKEIPVIFVTGQDTAESELVGLKAGGDDYIRKPYNLPVLLLRIQKQLLRSRDAGRKTAAEGAELDLVFGQLVFGGEAYELSRKELQILYCLFQNYPGTVSRDELISYLWENRMFVDENILNVNLSRIRKRLKGTPLDGFIQTVPDKGYRVGRKDR